MAQITFETTDALAYGLAVARGWTPTIEDITQEMVGDEYPHIANPVPYTAYVSVVVSKFLEDYVLNAGRNQILQEFSSKFATVEDRVKAGAFDALLLQGKFDDIKTLVKDSL